MQIHDYKSFFDLSSKLKFIIGHDDRFVFLDDRWPAELNCQASEIEHAGILAFIHPDDLQSTKSALQSIKLNKHQTLVFRNRYIKKTGIEIWLEWRATYSNECVYLLANEISEQVIKAKTLEFSQEVRDHYYKYRHDFNLILHHSLVSLIKFTESEFGFIGEVYQHNEQDHPLFMLRSIHDLNKPEISEQKFSEKVQEGIEINDDELLGISLKQNGIVFLNSITPAQLEPGLPFDHPTLKNYLSVPIYFKDKLMALVGLANRVSSYDQELKSYLTVITVVIGNVIQHIKQESLEKQIIQNEKLISVGLLAAGVGHEINNPLFIVSLSMKQIQSHLSQLGIIDENIKTLIEKHHTACDRIQGITDGLRNLSRATENTRKTFLINDVIQGITNLLHSIYESQGVTLKYYPSKENFPVLINFSEIQQVLLNLISNAKDAVQKMDQKEIIITTVKGFRHDVIVSVIDTGEGIEQKNIHKIFENFFTTKEIGKGTGLGLAIAKRIINDHNGELAVESKFGEGSTFSFTLPVYFSNATVPSTPTEISSNLSHVQLKGKKALVVDDEVALRELLSMMLEDIGLEVTQAGNGDEALLLLKENHFDYLITDSQMPGMSGEELIYKIINNNIKLPKTFLSTGMVIPQKKRINEMDITPHLSGILKKPYTVNEVVQLFLQEDI